MRQNKFEKRLANLPTEIWLKINKIDELKGRWISGAQLSSQTLVALKRSVLVTSTGASTRIEGAKLSDDDIEKLMKGISLEKFTDRDEQEVRGYYELLNNIFNAWHSLKFNESAIKHFHKELLRFVDKDKRHRGEYKTQENQVEMIDDKGKAIGVVFETIPAYLTPKAMQELIDWTQVLLKDKNIHPLLVIGNFLVEFLKIHPFIDGNGRLSRILTNLLLLQAGYEYMPYVSHEKLIEDNKPEYYLALRQSQKTFNKADENIVSWLNFLFDILLNQAQQAVALLSQENIEKLLSPKQLAVWQYLNTVEEAGPNEISEKAGVARPTINQAIDKLMRLKKVERLGLGRSTRYRKLSDLNK